MLHLVASDGLTVLSIIVKALAYATTLISAGSILIACMLSSLSEDDRRHLARLAGGLAFVAAIATTLRIPLRASFLMGGALEGAFDPMMLAMVAESPLGTSVAVRLAGLGLILPALLPHRWTWPVACLGAFIACASFSLRGHAMNEPRLLLGLLVTLHMLCLAFWLGAFAPLLRLNREAHADRLGPVAEEFGRKALWAVGGLACAGGAVLWIFGGSDLRFFLSPYGQLLLVKLMLFAGVLALAAVNKIRLTPAILAGNRSARAKLRVSVRLEAALILAILLTTAAVTTVTSPG